MKKFVGSIRLLKNEKRPVEGDNFVMKGESHSAGTNKVSLEFRQGESTEKKQKEIKIAEEKESERTKGFTSADHFKDFFEGIVDHDGSYSETLVIKENGQFDDIRMDGTSRIMLHESNTPEELYKIAKEIQDKYPEYKFSFEDGPHKEWIKYTVSKGDTREV
jgi:hypothetical protein